LTARLLPDSVGVVTRPPNPRLSMASRPVRSLFFATLLAIAAAILPLAAPASASTLPCDGQWHHVPSPSPAGRGVNLTAVVTISPFSAWAVGYRQNTFDSSRTLTEHWDGSNWTVVASPNVTRRPNVLTSVTAVSNSDVWAAGHASTRRGTTKTLIEHYDGTTWSVFPSPNPRPVANQLYAIEAQSATNVWAVGVKGPSAGGSTAITLTEHFDGNSWSVVKSPNTIGANDRLSAVKIISASDVWAVGSSAYSAGGPTVPIAVHWNGTRWREVSTPSVSSSSGRLSGLAVDTSAKVISVGGTDTASPLAERWNGTAWKIVPTAPADLATGDLHAVAGDGSMTWAVGQQLNADSTVSEALFEQWDGTTWTLVPPPTVGYDSLNGVSGEREFFWAVGSTKTAEFATSKTLIEGLCVPVPG
jgi:hypothetical protein